MQHIDELLDLIDEILDDAMTVPLAKGKTIVDADRIRDIINNIRAGLPNEIKQSMLIVSDRDDIIRDAKKEAEIIIRNSQDKARAMVADEEVSKQAREKASHIISQAQEKAKEIRNAAAVFSDSLLKETEDILSKNLSDVKNTRQALRTMQTKAMNNR